MPKPAMALMVALILLLPAGLASCGGSEPAGPDAAAENFIHLFNARKFGEAYDSLAQTSPFRNDSRAEFAAQMEKMYGDSPASYRWSGFRASEVVIEGETARVSWTAIEVFGLKSTEGDTIENTATVVREDGVWRVETPWEW